MPHVEVHLPNGGLTLAVLPVALLMLGLDVYALVHLVRAGRAPYLPTWLWVVLIGAVTPWGAVAYLLLARHAPVARGDTAPDGAVASADVDTSSGSGENWRADQALPPVVPPPAAVTVAGADAEPLVVTAALTRDYGGGAGLFDVDLRVPRGAVYGLVGPNGAGKSTLLSILAGVRRADSGTVRLGIPRAAIAVCPDVPEFEPWLTAFEVVDLARHYVAPALGPDAVWRALDTAGLAEVAGRRVGGFSRGMTQRLGLAAALVGDPQLLLLDEPTSALDPAGRAEILDLVAAGRGQRTVILSSHILADVQRVADHIGVLRAGRLLYEGDTRTFMDEHLAPRWTIRLSGPVDDVVTKLRGEPWVRRVEPLGDGRIRVDADTMAHGEHGIPAVLASCDAGLIAAEPLAADLETAFLALTRTEQTP